MAVLPPALLDRIIDDACRFIEACKRRHAAKIGEEVGQYLFEHVYGGDVAAAESRTPTKDDSLRGIAARTGISYGTLGAWVRAHVARKLLVPAGLPAALSMSSFEALRPLATNPAAARAAVELRERHGLTVQELDRLVVEWKRRIDEGGSLADLVRRPLPAEVGARVQRRAKRKRSAPPASRAGIPAGDSAVARLADLVLRWTRAAKLSAETRASLAAEAARVRDVVAGKRAGLAAAADLPLAATTATSAAGAEAPLMAPSERRRVIDEAVRFVRERIRRHGLELALEVGEHLFFNVFQGDRELYRNGGTWTSNTIQRIARDPRVQVSDDFLYRCIHAHLLVRQVGERAGESAVPALPFTAWAALWPLEDRPETLVPVAGWAAEERVPATTVQAVAALVEPYLAAGGKLDDLLVGSRRAGADTPYRRILRLLGVIDSLAVRRPPSPPARARALAALAAVAAGGSASA